MDGPKVSVATLTEGLKRLGVSPTSVDYQELFNQVGNILQSKGELDCICPNCDNTLPDMEFCPYCLVSFDGTSDVVEVDEVTEESPEEPKKRGRKKGSSTGSKRPKYVFFTKKDFEPVIIENVLKIVQKDQNIYVGTFPASRLNDLLKVKNWEIPGGYQRGLSTKRALDFNKYLDTDNAFLTPILINAGGNWSFTPNAGDSTFGNLECKNFGSILDGQHRSAGTHIYDVSHDGSSIDVPFMAFENLSLLREISLFDTINFTQKKLPPGIIKYNEPNEITKVAIALMEHDDSPFKDMVGIESKGSGKVANLATLDRSLNLMFTSGPLLKLSSEYKLQIALGFWNTVKTVFAEEWSNPKDYKLLDSVGLYALSKIGNILILKAFSEDLNVIDMDQVALKIKKLVGFDWARRGSNFQASGVGGSKFVAERLSERIYGK